LDYTAVGISLRSGYHQALQPGRRTLRRHLLPPKDIPSAPASQAW